VTGACQSRIVGQPSSVECLRTRAVESGDFSEDQRVPQGSHTNSIMIGTTAGPMSEAARPQDLLLSGIDLPLRRRFYPLGFGVVIATNDQEVLEAANESFGHRRLRHGSTELEIRIAVIGGEEAHCPPEPTRRQYNHLYSLVADAGNQALLDLRSGQSFVWLNRCALRNRLYLRHNFLEKVVYLLMGASVVTDIHAGCVSRNGRGILLCGDSGAGKSTLSYACARAGWTYTSDDTSYLINASGVPRVIGHAHRVRFRPAAKALFPELADKEITPRMEGKESIEVLTSELPPIETATDATVSSVVYLKRRKGGGSALVPLPPGSATQRMSQELYSAGEIRARHEQVLERLKDIPTFELHYCGLDEAIVELERLVGGP
jgi:hypothetical protein